MRTCGCDRRLISRNWNRRSVWVTASKQLVVISAALLMKREGTNASTLFKWPFRPLLLIKRYNKTPSTYHSDCHFWLSRPAPYEQALVCVSNREIVDASRGRTFNCEVAGNRFMAFLFLLCWPTLTSHLAAFNLNGLWAPSPHVSRWGLLQGNEGLLIVSESY